MKYRDLQIQTQRDFPSNMQTQGFGWLVRAGYITRENEILPLAGEVISRLQILSKSPTFLSDLSIPIIGNEGETFLPNKSGPVEVIHCRSCKYTERIELAQFKKAAIAQEEQLPLEKILTPDCRTIETLANFLDIPREKTAKALMFTRPMDGQFIFVVVRGDMTLSEVKLKNAIGDVRLATPEEIASAGAAAGYASPIGLNNALIVVDDIIPQSPNLVAGANETDHHFLNTNYGRDYTVEITTDLVLAKAGDFCHTCGNELSALSSFVLFTYPDFHFEDILFALAETHHDDKGLILPKSAAPFDVYLMHIPGKELDTRAKAEEIYESLQSADISVLFDDREERAGVKFNDADLIGCAVRVTVGEKNLKVGMVELKPRKEKENKLVQMENLIEELNNI